MLLQSALAAYRFMLRITIEEQGESTAIRLEGKLVGPWVGELKQCWQKILAGSTGKNLMTELDAVTYVDASGKELLQEMRRAGARLVGRGVLTSHMLDEIEKYCEGGSEREAAEAGAGRALKPDPLFLFACAHAWRRNADVDAGWELIRASKSPDASVRKVAVDLLAEAIVGRNWSQSLCMKAQASGGRAALDRTPWLADLAVDRFGQEMGMKTPYGMEIVDNCQQCRITRDRRFCNFSSDVMRSFSSLGHHSIFPAGALLFVEGQMPRGVFVLCAGKVKLSTTSRDGKILILRIAEAGEVLALSAVISGSACELTAETAAPCLVNFVERDGLVRFLGKHGEAGLHSAQVLSKEFQAAYQDIHDLVLARSSAGKLARLLLSWTPPQSNGNEIRIRSGLTHEEMAQMIGSSRETVTRLMTELKKKQFIRLDGSTLVIRNRMALEALAS